jgi:DMSO/TMAO reductase YedYZ heme-binding membrane subunit
MAKRTLKFLIIPGIISPILFFTLLTLLGLMWNGYNPISTGMSEIGAVDSPFKDIMNYAGFSLLGLLIVVFSIGLRIFFENYLINSIVFFIFLGGGICMFLVGFLPCDPQCIDVSQTGELHSLTSMLSAILISLAIILSTYSVSKKWGKRWGYATFCLGILSMASGPIMFIESLNNYTGLIQRLGIGFSLFWIFITSLKIYKEI